ncbi:MAG: C1 family peptidase [Clostridia bacterium]|nr:C1 family peptidase [Clostridia bacterium]
MKRLKKWIAVICTAALLVSVPAVANGYEECWNDTAENPTFVTAVEDQRALAADAQASCLYYALLSTAGSYCIKNVGLDAEKANFSEQALIELMGLSSNFGAVLYDAARFELGNHCYITGVEDLSKRGVDYIKKKVKENGAVTAAISLPAGGLENKTFFNEKTKAFYCPAKECDSALNHAVSIVGWSDTFSYEEFNEDWMPDFGGAWLCKNSYGTDFGIGGYFWLSYDHPIIYAAAIEVSQMKTVRCVTGTDALPRSLRRVGGVGFRVTAPRFSAEIEVLLDGKAAVTAMRNLQPGYVFLPLERPLWCSNLEVIINGETVPSPLLNCYFVSGGSPLAPSAPDPDFAWNMTVEQLTFSTKSGKPRAHSFDAWDNRIEHPVTLSAVDNWYYITPKDGTEFSDQIEIRMETSDVRNGQTLTPIPAAQADPSDNTQVILLPDGRIKLYHYGPALGAYATGLQLSVDSKGALEDAVKVMIGESAAEHARVTVERYVAAQGEESAAFSLDHRGTPVTAAPETGSYYAVVTVNGFYADAEQFSVEINGQRCTFDFEADGSTLTVGVVIEIPPVEATGFASIVIPMMLFINLFKAFGNVIASML